MSQEDTAQEVELRQWELNNVHRRQLREFKPEDDGYGPAFCQDDDCETEMPIRRRELGCKFCTDCQDIRERQSKMHRRN